MKKIFLASAVYLALIFIISSCTKNGPAGPIGPAGATGSTGPNLTGTLEGWVSTFDQYGYRVQSDQAGVSVKINDANNDSTLTDATGKYFFSNLSTGSYSVTYSRANYGTVLSNPFGFVGGIVDRNVAMSQIPNFALTMVADTIETVGTGLGVLVRGTALSDANQRSYIIFIGSASTVTSAPGSFNFVVTNTIKAGTTAWGTFFPAQQLYDAGITSGSTVYFAVYPYATGATTYTDLTTGKTIYTGITSVPSFVASAIVP
jgi:hypothetical protein